MSGPPQPSPAAAPTHFVRRGRILYLSAEAAPLRAQLAGATLPNAPPLCDNISTDEITPGWVCFWYDATLGRHTLVGLRHGVVAVDAVRDGGFDILVAGASMGCGSSRETAPYSHRAAGIRLVVARSFEKIYRQNCHNIGLLTSTDFALLARLAAGEAVPLAEFEAGLDPISATVVRHGGLLAYARGGAAPAPPARPAATRPPQTLTQKIVAAHSGGDAAVGDALLCRTDVRFSHDYTTAMAAALFEEAFGADAAVADAASCVAFADHLPLLGEVMPAAQVEAGLLARARGMAARQAAFCAAQGIRLYGASAEGGAEAICHNAVLDDIARPGQLVVGTDSHTCTAGALGCLAFGVGATDMAYAWHGGAVRLTVPPAIEVVLRGRLRPGVSAKDVMLTLLAMPLFAAGGALGHVLEFVGDGVAGLDIDARATLTNMAVEGGAMTGIVAADARAVAFVAARPGAAGAAAALPAPPTADPGAAYAHRLALQLADVVPMVALPGDPRRGQPLAQLPPGVRIDVAYGGSCTGGKRDDMQQYAAVLAAALARGQTVAAGVRLYIQCGSQAIRADAERRGYLDIFRRAGAQIVAPACGACIRAGPGASTRADQVTIAATSRNFPGRSGPGQVYLASPATVAASAIAGCITSAGPLLGAGAGAGT